MPALPSRHCDRELNSSVVYACHSKTAQATFLIAEEPIVSSHTSAHSSAPPFRRYATTSIPGHATDISFYRHTLAVVTDRQIVIVEPGNPTFSIMPSPLEEQAHGQDIARLVGQGKSKALGMFQVQEHEFVLVWDWGACFVNRSKLARSFCAPRPLPTRRL